MRDRITAIADLLTTDSTPTRGTRVQGEAPDPWVRKTSNRDRL